MAGLACLEEHIDDINKLNVFPVPDGDTGTNMFLTMKSALQKFDQADLSNLTAGEVSIKIAHNALLGARGNSGVILSQYLKGFASAFENEAECNATTIKHALVKGSEVAYQAVGTPVEGTMLTVMRAAARIVNFDARSLSDVWGGAYSLAHEALAATPEQLPILKQARVVDAGGQGIVAFLAGSYAFLTGQDTIVIDINPFPKALSGSSDQSISTEFLQETVDEAYGYCTQFIINAPNIDLDLLKERVSAIALSTVVIGDRDIARVHAHASDPGILLSLAVSIGSLADIHIENMDTMHGEFLSDHGITPDTVEIAIVAVSPGDGISRLFRDLGVSSVVEGGNTMNPSAEDLLKSADASAGRNIVFLPNNPNILMAATQAAELCGKNCVVIPTTNVPAGLAATLAFNPDADLESNVTSMTASTFDLITGEIVTAIRNVDIDDLKVRKGHYIGISDGHIIAAESDLWRSLNVLLSKLNLQDRTLITLYWGGELNEDRVTVIADHLQAKFPSLEIEVLYGGQPNYHFFISIE